MLVPVAESAKPEDIQRLRIIGMMRLDAACDPAPITYLRPDNFLPSESITKNLARSCFVAAGKFLGFGQPLDVMLPVIESIQRATMLTKFWIRAVAFCIPNARGFIPAHPMLLRPLPHFPYKRRSIHQVISPSIGASHIGVFVRHGFMLAWFSIPGEDLGRA